MGRLKQYYFDQLTQLDDTWWREDMADMAYQDQKQAEDEFCQHWVQLDHAENLESFDYWTRN